MEELVALCKRRGFIFQSNEIYGGLQGLYDYGPLGVELKNNLKQSWWREMVFDRDDVEGLDASILTKPNVLKFSGHEDTFSENNLLTRGQEIAVDVNESEAVAAALSAGQASMHHGLLFHSSDPNKTDHRRIGSAIRYIKPSMKQDTGDLSLVTLVSGQDHFNNFKIANPPKGRLLEEDFDLCREDSNLKQRLLFK